MKFMLNATGLPLQDLVFGASVYFPPFFKAFAFGFVIWLVIHRLLRGWIYAGDIWHPLLMDLSLFAICVLKRAKLFKIDMEFFQDKPEARIWKLFKIKQRH